ncbi:MULTISPECIES: error-prone DNA polymerase [unclassified Sphingomonas]|uniref:error-prone DNA polymerase n=1 Tax=unclassified Sphingomonas TaxID=196159 RepID=UPI0006F99B7A|nr:MULTISPECIES: error-prone DNA polymerase [unclassified Sphingomonas]KQX19575.1 DNA polymerase [Sphingomonas sp. Root1294]KQY65776.1 DNA polymerase [Sphingomonas sp. Root50]KRB94918.1 DNA polymerase [Sphingomonas sp. Root720]
MSAPDAPFVEMAAATNYSFLRGASPAEDMVAAAIAAGHAGIGIADRNTVAGVVRAWKALRDAREQAREDGLPDFAFKLATGARLVFADGTPDIIAYPATRHGWGRLTRLLTVGNRRAIKGDCILFLDDLLGHLDDLLLIVMPGGEGMTLGEEGARLHPSWEGPIKKSKKTDEQPHAPGTDADFPPSPQRRLGSMALVAIDGLRVDEPSAGASSSGALQAVTGMDPGLRWDDGVKRTLSLLKQAAPDRVWLGLSMPYSGRDRRRRSKLARIAAERSVPLLATNDVLYATPDQRPLHDIVTCIRLGLKIDQAGTKVAANAERHLKPSKEMARLFGDYPEALAEGIRLLDRIGFDLGDLRYEYPHEPVPEGQTPQGWLEHLVRKGITWRYGDTPDRKVLDLVETELKLVRREQYAYYFLTVHDVVRHARDLKILCQGRGSAANSVICYVLGITEVDPVANKLLFSRFISEDRKEPPDIDVDFEHERREEVMQYVFNRYGRHRAGIAATVIHYRPRSAVREIAKVLGLSEDVAAKLTSTIWGSYAAQMEDKRFHETGFDPGNVEIGRLNMLVAQLLTFPRHLSQHVGGFVLTEDRLDETVPIHNAAMEDRTFIEWDKDDIDALKLMKVDILALGMLTCIRKAFALIDTHIGRQYTLANIPPDQGDVYDMLCKGDSIGVFQVESRAQINMLPRLKPRELYDLVIQVAIVRPGPIQGGMVHPYLRRRQELEPVVYPSPGPDHDPDELREVLGKTLGVPLFQEQAMKLAIVAAGFSDAEANQLRRAMATFRNVGTMPKFERKMVEGMVDRGYPRDFAERCFEQIKGFGSYGFPESHAQSFALLVYASSYIKCRYPAVFACALLNAQPMGFYAPAQIVRDAREHGVEVRAADVNRSGWDNGLEDGHPHLALRIGLRQLDGFREAWADAIVAARGQGAFTSIEELARRATLPRRAIRLLADADAFRSLGLDRRTALWEARRTPDGELPLFAAAKARELGEEPDAMLPAMPLSEHVAADYQLTRLSLKGHPMQFLRETFRREGVLSCREVSEARNGRRAKVAGVVLVRQRPGEGKAIFITLEDETGIANVLLWARTFEVQRRQVMASRLMVVEGEIQKSPEGVVHLMGAIVHDRTAELDRLSEDHRAEIELARADVFEHPQPPRHHVPRGSHPRDVRILPKSRDFH